MKRPSSDQPIPDHAQKVFTGKIFDVYQWQQDLNNGQSATFEKIKRSDTAEVVAVTEDQKIIVLNEQQPGQNNIFYGTPGGRMEPNETPEQTVLRELKEETGYTSNNLIPWFACQPTSKIDWAIYVFIAYDCFHTTNQKTDAGEKIKINLLTVDEFISLSRNEKFRDTEIAIKIHQMETNSSSLSKLLLRN